MNSAVAKRSAGIPKKSPTSRPWRKTAFACETITEPGRGTLRTALRAAHKAGRPTACWDSLGAEQSALSSQSFQREGSVGQTSQADRTKGRHPCREAQRIEWYLVGVSERMGETRVARVRCRFQRRRMKNRIATMTRMITRIVPIRPMPSAATTIAPPCSVRARRGRFDLHKAESTHPTGES